MDFVLCSAILKIGAAKLPPVFSQGRYEHLIPLVALGDHIGLYRLLCHSSFLLWPYIDPFCDLWWGPQTVFPIAPRRRQKQSRYLFASFESFRNLLAKR